MGALLTPKLVRQVADSLGASSGPEWALAFALATSPLPAGWASVASEDGAVTFIHDSGLVPPQQEHPLLPSARHALARLRRQQAAAAPDGASASASSPGAAAARLLGPFEDFDSPGTEFFYLDITTGEAVPEYECPPNLVIPELPDELRQMLLAEAGEDGEDGEGADDGLQQEGEPDFKAAGGGAASAGGATWDAESAAAAASAAEQSNGRVEEFATDGGAEASPFGAAEAEAERAATASATSRGSGSGGGGAADYAAGLGPSSSRPASAAGSAAAAAARSRTPSRASSVQGAGAALEGLALDPGGGGGGGGTGDGADGAGAPVSISRRGTGDSGGAGDPLPSLPSRSATAEGTLMQASTISVLAEPSRDVAFSAVSDPPPPPPPPAGRPPSAAAARAPSAAASAAASMGGASVAASEASYGSGSRSSGGGGGNGGGGGAASGIGGRRSGAGSVVAGGSAGPEGSPVASRSRAVSAVSARSGAAAAGGGIGISGGGGGALGGSPSGTSVSASGGGRGVVPPPSGRLTFFGWWFEDIESSDLTFRIDCKQTAGGGLAPRHCSLSYDFASATFTFAARDPVTPPAPGQPADRVPELVVPGIPPEQVTLCDTGRCADVWDLHLGARLSVLGRPLVLKNAELATAQWHAGYCRRLAAMREQLAQELQKYKPRVLRPGLVRDKGSVRQQTGQQLRHMAAQVREMAEDLRQYRPAKAESFLEALPPVV